MRYIAHGLARDDILSVSSEELSRVELLLHSIKRFIKRHTAAIESKNLRHLHFCFDKCDIGNFQGHVFVGIGNQQAARVRGGFGSICSQEVVQLLVNMLCRMLFAAE